MKDQAVSTKVVTDPEKKVGYVVVTLKDGTVRVDYMRDPVTHEVLQVGDSRYETQKLANENRTEIASINMTQTWSSCLPNGDLTRKKLKSNLSRDLASKILAIKAWAKANNIDDSWVQQAISEVSTAYRAK